MRTDEYNQSIETLQAVKEGIIANDPQLMEFMSRIQNGESIEKLKKEFTERNKK